MTLESKFHKELTKYQKTLDQFLPQIENELKNASASLQKAISIAEKNGIHFDSDISFLYQSYFSKSVISKFPILYKIYFSYWSDVSYGLKKEFKISDSDLKKMREELEGELKIYRDEKFGDGWQHS